MRFTELKRRTWIGSGILMGLQFVFWPLELRSLAEGIGVAFFVTVVYCSVVSWRFDRMHRGMHASGGKIPLAWWGGALLEDDTPGCFADGLAGPSQRMATTPERTARCPHCGQSFAGGFSGRCPFCGQGVVVAKRVRWSG